jgi:hypothetical protein
MGLFRLGWFQASFALPKLKAKDMGTCTRRARAFIFSETKKDGGSLRIFSFVLCFLT